MADNVQTYTTRIFLNTEEAKKRLDELQSKAEELGAAIEAKYPDLEIEISEGGQAVYAYIVSVE